MFFIFPSVFTAFSIRRHHKSTPKKQRFPKHVFKLATIADDQKGERPGSWNEKQLEWRTVFSVMRTIRKTSLGKSPRIRIWGLFDAVWSFIHTPNRFSGHLIQSFLKTPSRVKILMKTLLSFFARLQETRFLGVFLFVWYVLHAVFDLQRQVNGRRNQNGSTWNLSSGEFYMCPDKCTPLHLSTFTSA